MEAQAYMFGVYNISLRISLRNFHPRIPQTCLNVNVNESYVVNKKRPLWRVGMCVMGTLKKYQAYFSKTPSKTGNVYYHFGLHSIFLSRSGLFGFTKMVLLMRYLLFIK